MCQTVLHLLLILILSPLFKIWFADFVVQKLFLVVQYEFQKLRLYNQLLISPQVMSVICRFSI